jgi:excisionase family DNA binding protein
VHDTLPRGYTPNELSRLLRISPDRVRALIHSGELPALNLARHRCSRPKYVVLPHHLEQFERGRVAAKPPQAPRKRRQPARDYFADLPDEGSDDER